MVYGMESVRSKSMCLYTSELILRTLDVVSYNVDIIYAKDKACARVYMLLAQLFLSKLTISIP
jgi:hypothetical protein